MIDAIGQRKAVLVLMILAMFILSGCGNQPIQGYEVGDAFTNFYPRMGGVENLGPCISPQFVKNGVTYQYTQKVLMAYDPTAPSAQQYTFGKIGYEINLDLAVIPDGGYKVWEDVEPVNKETGGVIGRAVTDVLQNDEKQRYEQYFEGAGFFRYYNDPAGMIQWMDYGEWMCGLQCLDVDLAIIGEPTPVVTPDVDNITLALVAYGDRLGDFYTGQLLISKARPVGNGLYEIVYENVVLVVHQDDLGNVSLLHLPEKLGYVSDVPVACTSQDGFICYPLGDGLVRMIPVAYYDFIVQNGGFELSGEPITNLRPGSGGASYQCFRNLCLESRAGAPEGLQVRVMPLGVAYNRMDMAAPFVTPNAPHMLVISTWPRYADISTSQSQEIYVQAMQGTMPVANILFSLTVTYPDGTTVEETFPLTDFNGRAYLTLDPIHAPEGTNIPYVACYQGGAENVVCIPGAFMIWSYAP